MHKQFVRLFLSIALITIVVLFAELLIITFFGQKMVHIWTDSVFDEFASSLENNLDQIEVDQSTMSVNLFATDISERISGFVMRSAQGGQMIAFGKNGRGQIVPQLNYSNDGSFSYIGINYPYSSEKDKINTYDIKKPKYRIDLTTEGIFSLTVTNATMAHLTDRGRVEVQYPESIEKNDIAGTIAVYINDQPYCFLDILVYSVDYYTPTRIILIEVYKGLALSLPIVLILALILAYVVSRRTAKNVSGILSSLSLIANGQFDVTIQQTKVHEFNQIGASIKKLGQDLKRHSASRKEWIRNISHDLNTPVTSMNILLEGAEDGIFPLNMELVKALKKENDSLKDRIQSVSYYSFLLGPDAVVKKEYYSINNEVMNIALSLGVDIQIEDENILVYADSTLLTRALEEIINNAKEYGKGEIKLIVTQTKDATTILVSNLGSLPSPRPNFFEPWSRGDFSRTSGGSGLGLPIVYQIMELHEGRVEINEVEDRVEVTLVFPN